MRGVGAALRSLNYEDCVCDGLYDLWGSFPELRAAGPAGCFPALTALARIPFWPGDVREVRANLFAGRAGFRTAHLLSSRKVFVRACPYMPCDRRCCCRTPGRSCTCFWWVQQPA